MRLALCTAAIGAMLAAQPIVAQTGRLGVLGERLRGARGGDRAKGSESAQIAGLRVSIWRPRAGAPAPLVIFSHGFHGTSTQSAFLMRALADAGYLVIAPNHKDAGGSGGLRERPETGFGKPDEWSDATYRDRADDITSLVRTLKADPQWNTAIDWSKLALAGHSLGGYTVLGLAGAWRTWTLPGVKAVLALSPYAAPFISRHTLGDIRVPVMYQGGTRDIGISPALGRTGGAFDSTPAPAYYVEFQRAGHLAWTDLVPDFQTDVDHYGVAFLNAYVKNGPRDDLSRRLADVAALRAK